MNLQELASARYRDNPGNRKPAHYYAFYEELFADIGRERIALLELGVHSGSSLLAWHDYLGGSRVVGVDISPMPPAIQHLVANRELGFIQLDQESPDLGDQVLVANDGHPYDIIIDDASHLGVPTRKSFQSLFGRALRHGGYYVVEDYGTGYWRDWPDGREFSCPRDPVPANWLWRLKQLMTRGSSRNAATSAGHEAGAVGAVKELVDYLNFPDCVPSDGAAIERLIYLPAIMAAKKR